MGAVLSTSSKKKVLGSRKSRKQKRTFLKMLLIATIATFTCLTVANPHHNSKVNPRIICNLLICREGVLQREAGRQVGGRRRGGRRQGALHQGLRGLHRVRQQCGRHQRDGRLLQRVRQVRGHNDLHKATVAFLDAKISGASKVDALKAAATTYTDYIADYPDPDSACFKSQDSL